MTSTFPTFNYTGEISIDAASSCHVLPRFVNASGCNHDRYGDGGSSRFTCRVAAYWHKPTATNLAQRMFNGKEEWSSGKPVQSRQWGIAIHPNTAKERYLSSAETQRLHEALSRSDNTQLKSIVTLLLLFGCRKRELLDAEWEHSIWSGVTGAFHRPRVQGSQHPHSRQSAGGVERSAALEGVSLCSS